MAGLSKVCQPTTATVTSPSRRTKADGGFSEVKGLFLTPIRQLIGKVGASSVFEGPTRTRAPVTLFGVISDKRKAVRYAGQAAMQGSGFREALSRRKEARTIA